MPLNDSVFEIDAREWTDRITKFVRDRVDATARDGIVVTLSGGLDSSVVAALCVRAVGADRVTGLMLPELFGNPEAKRCGRLIAEHLGIRSRVISVTRAIRAVRSANPLLALTSGRARWSNLVNRALATRGHSTHGTYLDSLSGTMDPLRRRTLADVTSKHRVRMVVAYKFADENGLLLAGAAHRTEALTGLFCKYGVDDCADVMPIANAFRSEVLRLAEFLDIPGEIRARTPNPDIIPGVTDKYVDYFGIDYRAVDLILVGLERGMTPAQIAHETTIDKSSVDLMDEVVRRARPLRAHAVAPALHEGDVGIR